MRAELRHFVKCKDATTAIQTYTNIQIPELIAISTITAIIIYKLNYTNTSFLDFWTEILD